MEASTQRTTGTANHSSERRARFLRHALLVSLVASLAAATSGCGDSGSDPKPFRLDTLAISTETVQAAVEFMTTGPIKVPTNCAGDVLVNCLTGSPGAPVSLGATLGAVTITPVSAGVYSFATDLAVTSLQGIPIRLQGFDCTLGINTASGTSPTVHVTGTATFASHSSDGAINRLDITPAVTGLESADLSLTGGIACQVASSFQGFILSTIEQAFEGIGGHLCGAPGAPLFMECPALPLVYRVTSAGASAVRAALVRRVG